jgi:hypothetical protein
LTSSSSFSTLASATVTIGGVTGTFNVTTEALDTTPDAFAFPGRVDVIEESTQTSHSITVSGINAPAAISIGSGHPTSAYSINGGSFTATAGTVVEGDGSGCGISPPPVDDVTHTTLVIGGVSVRFKSRIDTTPNAVQLHGGHRRGPAVPRDRGQVLEPLRSVRQS